MEMFQENNKLKCLEIPTKTTVIKFKINNKERKRRKLLILKRHKVKGQRNISNIKYL